MRTVTVFLVLIAVVFLGLVLLAQTTYAQEELDKVYKTDRSIVEGKVLMVTDEVIQRILCPYTTS